MKLWDLIDSHLAYTIEVATDAATLNSSAAPYRTHRERLWLRAQQILEEFWGSWEWEFRYSVGGSATLTIGNTSCAAPSDYHIGSYEGSVWIPANNRELGYLPLHLLMVERRVAGSATGMPLLYSIADTDSSGVPQFVFERTADATYTLAVDYERRAPLLLDKSPAPVAADAGSSGNVDGSVIYKLIMVNADGTSDGYPSNTLTITTQIVSLTGLYVPPGFANVTSKRLYRSEDSGTTYRLVATIPLADTTYNDNIATASLGATLTAFSGLEKVPSEYHTCITQGLEVLDAKDHGDGRSAAELEGRWRRTLARAKANSIGGRERLTRIGEVGISQYRMH